MGQALMLMAELILGNHVEDGSYDVMKNTEKQERKGRILGTLWFQEGQV